MAITVLFGAHPRDWPEYEAPLRAAFDEAGLAVDLATDHPPETVDYIVYAPNSPITEFTRFTRLKAVLNLWAGVEAVVGNPTLTVPLCRMVEPGLTEGMVEWVTGMVLRHHLGIDRYIGRSDGVWEPVFPPLARDRTVGMLGLGELGRASAEALVALNFRVLGWSRSPKKIAGVKCFDGSAGLRQVLAEAEILVLLLPATAETENSLDAEALAQLPSRAVIINPGRGKLVDDDALLAALDSGHIAHATLDVFRREPLDPAHPYWAHPGVTVTPHVASDTRAATSALSIAENIRRGEAGEPFLNEVDRARGY
ncbi:2-hydroxyacid dehydrogenase [Ovoidimarina sediminis]|uniref:2-hydroxyacid dehydrogenase n=1 Tax=Ovoidimarina sediminis TaxID=3079856 RepID=UPI00290D59D7|nr:glyoxylate/hydroxypyruvate reductase A [Rhodophyticola sp. MJ-SS7]MDU8945492.1 glyoxylate/hydroxypyruvate reductase A [Rhodophyticola sp. MJ-SS7]